MIEVQEILAPISLDLAQADTLTMLEKVIGIDRSQLPFHSSKELTTGQKKTLEIWCTTRLKGVPLPYVLGETYFYNSTIKVNQHTLIPRPDTEHLIEAIITTMPSTPLSFLELGTGSGCIPRALIIEREHWQGVAVDVSEEALTIAHTNNPTNVTFIQSNLFDKIEAAHQFDFIVSNPPYIPSKVVAEDLEPCVTDYEPLNALDGGESGLEFYEYLATTGKSYLKPMGWLFLEIGYDQGESVPLLLSQNGWQNITLINDFGNRPRVVQAQLL